MSFGSTDPPHHRISISVKKSDISNWMYVTCTLSMQAGYRGQVEWIPHTISSSANEECNATVCTFRNTVIVAESKSISCRDRLNHRAGTIDTYIQGTLINTQMSLLTSLLSYNSCLFYFQQYPRAAVSLYIPKWSSLP